MQLTWAPLSDLPAPRQAEKRGRDVWYSDHVVGRPLTALIEKARDWFAELVAEPTVG
jgi:hypothetical protein